ncbi:carbon-nitrogen hydrolase family protein [Bacteroidota bacterium]
MKHYGIDMQYLITSALPDTYKNEARDNQVFYYIKDVELKRTDKMKHLFVIRLYLVTLLSTVCGLSGFAQVTSDSPIEVELVRNNFATITNKNHPGNRIGYRFHEHTPIPYGNVPLSDQMANIDKNEINALIDNFQLNPGLFTYKHEIPKSEDWSQQDWTYYMVPVEDGIELLLIIRTYGEGLPAYYGIQQCFRMSGETNETWRKEIANTPAFSEYDLWNSQKPVKEKQSLTYVHRNDSWQTLPVKENSTGARSPSGIAIDFLRTGGIPTAKVGPYEAEMLDPIDIGLITRVDKNEKWVCGIYWDNTSHVTDHHPADCIHSIVNIGNIPPYSEKAISGKIYWFKGTKDDLYEHYRNDFIKKATKKLTIASCQFPVTGDISENAGHILQQMRLTKIQGAEVVHFPECALSGYGGADFEDYENFNWDDLKAKTNTITTLADELNLWILLGSTHRLSEGNNPHNSIYVINPNGQVIDRYDKRFCTSSDLEYYSPGDHFVNFRIKDINCGLLICYDVRFPELYREYRKTGTDIIFQSFYNARSAEDGIHPKIMPVSAQVRAATNSFYMSLTNSSAPYSWPCYFITPDGLVSKKLPANKPGILISSVDVTKKYYDASRPYRLDAMNGKLNSGDVIKDPKSEDRTSY